jgi:tetratricopeptide (TPR) repeat protein
MKPLKYLPHFGLLALIVFLITDIPKIVGTSSKIKSQLQQSEGSDSEGSHKEGSNGQNIPQKEKRMGVFHYNEGNKSFKDGRFDEAIINYKKALHHNKNFKEATINLSTAYMKNSNYEKALETLKMGMFLDSKNPHIHYNYACYYSLIGQPKRSLEMLKAAIHFGFNKPNQIKIDPDLQKLRQSPEFKRWSHQPKI